MSYFSSHPKLPADSQPYGSFSAAAPVAPPCLYSSLWCILPTARKALEGKRLLGKFDCFSVALCYQCNHMLAWCFHIRAAANLKHLAL